MRGMALSELLMGVLLGALVLITQGMELNLVVMLLLVAVAVVPSLVLCIAVTKKCNEFLKNGVE